MKCLSFNIPSTTNFKATRQFHILLFRVICTPCDLYWRCPWCNGYRRKNWTRRHEFKSWTRLIAFQIALEKDTSPFILPPAMGK